MTKSAAITATGSPSTEHALAPGHDQDWRSLWLATQEQDRPWRSLALVPAGPGLSNETILSIGVTLSHTGMAQLGGTIHVVDGTRVRLAGVDDFVKEIRRGTERDGDRVLIALAAPAENATSVTLARAADCAVLCVLRGMRTLHMKRTIDEVGCDHFLGSAMFRHPSEPE